MQYCYTSKAWHVGSNAYAPTPGCLADDRASFWFYCNLRRPVAASQLCFPTPDLDQNGVSRVIRGYQIPFRQERSQLCYFLSGITTCTANRVRCSMIVSAYEHFSPVRDADSFCIRQYLLRHVDRAIGG